MNPADVAIQRDGFLASRLPVDFNYDEIDRNLAVAGDAKVERELRDLWSNEERCSEGAEVLSRLLDLLIPVAIDCRTLQAIGVKAVCLAWMIQSGKADLGSESLAQIAKRLGVTRALLSHWIRHFEESLGFHSRGQKLSSTPAVFAESASRGWETRLRNGWRPRGKKKGKFASAVAD